MDIHVILGSYMNYQIVIKILCNCEYSCNPLELHELPDSHLNFYMTVDIHVILGSYMNYQIVIKILCNCGCAYNPRKLHELPDSHLNFM